MASRFSIPIMAWVILGLAIVTLLPFLVSTYLIERSDENVIDQTQVSHLIVARSVATQIDSYGQLLQGLLVTAGDSPSLYLDPTSESALEVLQGLMVARDEIQSLGLYRQSAGVSEEIYVLRKPGVEIDISSLLGDDLTDAPSLVGSSEAGWIRVQQETTRPGLFIAMLLSLDQVRGHSRPDELGDSAELVILDADRNVIQGDEASLAMLPAQMLGEAINAPVRSSVHRFATQRGQIITALAHVTEMDWVVISLQPARYAEQATAAMRTIAWQSTLAMGALSVLLAVGAWFGVLKPIRRILSAQRGLLGGQAVGSGSEIMQLQASFERLEAALNERDSLSEVFLGRYQIVSKLGSGAMGMVYLGWDPKLKREVALKTIRIASGIDPDERRKLTRSLINEGVHSAQLMHPNIVTVFDSAGNDEVAFIAMQLIDGESLEERLRRAGKLMPDQVMQIADSVLAGLSEAHAAGIIHRDIKPGNVLINRRGVVKVTDFGIASTVQMGRQKKNVIMGTPGYIAPECYRAEGYSAKTDLFAVGVLIVECLTGRQVFAGRSTQQIMTRTQAKDVRLPGVLMETISGPLLRLIKGLLKKDPRERIASADEARALIQSAVALLPDGILLDDTVQTVTGEMGRDEDSSTAQTTEVQLDEATRRIDLDQPG